MIATQYASTWVREYAMYWRIDVLMYLTFTMELGLYLKDYCPYLDSSYFVVNLRIYKELIYWVTYSS